MHVESQTGPQRHLQRVALGARGVEQGFQRHGKHIGAMARSAQWRDAQHVGGRPVQAGDVAVGVHTHQTVAVAAQRLAGPVQAQQETVGSGQRQRVFDAARRLRDQVLEGGLFDHVHAGEVEHAHALAVRSPDGRAGAAVDAGGVKEMFATVQPHRLQLGQRGPDGGGAHGALRQVHPHTRDVGCLRVVPVHRAVHVDHHAAGVGEDGEVARVGHGPRERLDHRRRGPQQRLVGVDGVAHHAVRDRVERDGLVRVEAHAQAATPGAVDPR